jgi:tripartite-type tricarboxylate transporter receptor subunit TctC
VPTVAEAGLPGYEAASWYGLVVPAATQAAVVERLSTETAKAVAGAELRQRLAGQGIEPMPGGATEFRRYLQSETAKWAKVVRDANIPPQ